MTAMSTMPLSITEQIEECWNQFRPDRVTAEKEGLAASYEYVSMRGTDIDGVLSDPKPVSRTTTTQRTRRERFRVMFRIVGLAPKPHLPRTIARQLNAGIMPTADLSGFRMTRRQKSLHKDLKRRAATAKQRRLITA